LVKDRLLKVTVPPLISKKWKPAPARVIVAPVPAKITVFVGFPESNWRIGRPTGPKKPLVTGEATGKGPPARLMGSGWLLMLAVLMALIRPVTSPLAMLNTAGASRLSSTSNHGRKRPSCAGGRLPLRRAVVYSRDRKDLQRFQADFMGVSPGSGVKS